MSSGFLCVSTVDKILSLDQFADVAPGSFMLNIDQVRGLVKAPKINTRALSPAGTFEGKAPPRLAAQKIRPHAHLEPTHSTSAYFLCEWEA